MDVDMEAFFVLQLVVWMGLVGAALILLSLYRSTLLPYVLRNGLDGL